MGKIKSPEPALLFISTLYCNEDTFNRSREVLEKNFGEILFTSPTLPWNYSTYYKDEIGWPLLRQFIFFQNLIDPGLLSDIKLILNHRLL